MRNSKTYIFFAAALAMIIPVPGRTVFAVYLLVLFNILIVLTTLLNSGIKKLGLEKHDRIFFALEIISVTILYKQIMTLICPVVSLTLSFAIYLPAVSSVLAVYFLSEKGNGIKEDLCEKLKSSGKISLFVFCIFLVRDIIGFGTLTLPGWKKIITLHILPSVSEKLSLGVFFATIPGCLVLIAVILFCSQIFASGKKIEKTAEPDSTEENK